MESKKPLTHAEKLRVAINSESFSIEDLRTLAWRGVPLELRASVWRVLLGCLPEIASRRPAVLKRTRAEYLDALVRHNVDVASFEGDRLEEVGDEAATRKQIALDTPRTAPGVRLFRVGRVELALKRLLYLWAMRHPASGYVQGMNDLATPFLYVFIVEQILEFEEKEGAVGDKQIETGQHGVLQLESLDFLPQERMDNAEADTYYCFSALLDDIQDHYTFSQPGLQRRVIQLQTLVQRLDPDLYEHFEHEKLQFLQFAFRWMNCLLMRELSLGNILRLWDTYLSEPQGFSTFHVYTCAALLITFSEDLQKESFQELVMFLQRLPTEKWSENDVELLLSQAYMWKNIFNYAPSNLKKPN